MMSESSSDVLAPDLLPLLTKVFKLMDSDNDGHLDEREGWAIGRALGGSGADARTWWTTILAADTDKSGTIELNEWLEFNKAAYAGKEAAGLVELQVMHDRLEESQSRRKQQISLALAADAPVEDALEEIDLDGSTAAPPPAEARLEPATKDALRARFEAMDTDGDGVVTREELGDLDDLLGLDEAQVEALFKQADKDGSGSISFDEFCAAVDAFDQAEQDGQGALNALLPE